MSTKEKIVCLVVAVVVAFAMLLFVSSCGSKENICIAPQCKPMYPVSGEALCSEVTHTLCKRVFVDCAESPSEEVFQNCRNQMYSICVDADGYSPSDADRVYNLCLPTIYGASCSTFESEEGPKLIADACGPKQAEGE